jgi:hypothetical protein
MSFNLNPVTLIPLNVFYVHSPSQLVVAEADQKHLVELQFARSLPHHHRVSHAGLIGGGNAEELHVMQVRM